MTSPGRIYRAEEIEIDAGTHFVRRGGQAVHLRQQAMQVLVRLLDNRHRIVTRDELIESVWSGLAVTDDVLAQCITEIRKALGDDRRAPRFIRTVPKVGYHFIASVEETTTAPPLPVVELESTTAVEMPTGEPATEAAETEPVESVDPVRVEPIKPVGPGEVAAALRHPTPGVTRRPPRAMAWLAAAIVVIGAGAGAWRLRQASPAASTARGLFLMPVANRTGRADLDWLSAGVPDMLVTDLSRAAGLSIIGPRQAAQALRRSGLADDESAPLDRAMAIARANGAEDVLVGSVAAAGDTVRIDVQVYDTASGRLLTTERSTVDRVDGLFSAVDALSLKLIERLGATVAPGASHRDAAQVLTSDIHAYEAYVAGLRQANALHIGAAVAEFTRATTLDPDFAMAYARLGYAHVMTVGDAAAGKPYLAEALRRGTRLADRNRRLIEAWYATANADFGAAIELYRRVIAADPGDSEAYWRLGHLLAGEERFDEALSTLDRGLAIDPQSADLLNDRCIVLSDVGRHPDAIAACARALAVAPTEANIRDSLGLAYLAAGNLSSAIEAFTDAIALDPTFGIAYLHRAIAWYHGGHNQRAADDCERYLGTSGASVWRGYEMLAWIERCRGHRAEATRALAALRRASPHAIGDLLLRLELELGVVDRSQLDDSTAPPALARGTRLSTRFDCDMQGTRAVRAGHIEEGLEWFRQIQTHRPVTWALEPLDDALANALFDLGRVDEAIPEYRRALARAPQVTRAHYQLARAYDRAGRRGDARREFTEFLSLWKDADDDAPEKRDAQRWLDGDR